MDELELALQEMEKRCEAAPEGPWVYTPRADEQSYCTDDVMTASEPCLRIANVYGGPDYPPHVADSDFIAHARTDLPRLIAGFREAMRGCVCTCSAESIEEGTCLACKALSLARSNLAGGG